MIGFYDDLIVDHRKKSDQSQIAKEIFSLLESEILEEIADEVFESFVCGEICMSIIHELVCDEALSVINDVLMHYGARVAFSQYRHITKVGT